MNSGGKTFIADNCDKGLAAFTLQECISEGILYHRGQIRLPEHIIHLWR